MTTDPPIPWWQRHLALAALLPAATVPLLWPALPPLTDLPGHVARWHIAAAGPDSPLSAYYAVRWALMGNLGTDLLAIPLAPLLGPAGTAKLIMIAIVLLTMIGMIWLAREAHGRVPPTTLFALPLAYAWPFQMGFANFVLAQALAFCALALWLRLGRAGRHGLRAFLFAPIGLILWTTHSAGWGLFGLMAFGAELARQRESGSGWWRAAAGSALACLPLTLPVLVMLIGRSGDARASDTGDWFNFPAKLLWLVSTFRDRWQWFDVASLGIAAFILYLGVRDRRLGMERRLGWPALLCLAGFLLLPRLLLGGSYVDMRLMPAVWTLALLAIRPPADARLARALAVAGLAFLFIRTGATTLSLIRTASEQSAELGALDHIPRGAPVLAMVFKPCARSWSDNRAEHLPAYAILRRDAFVNEQWAIPGQHYISVRYAVAMPFVADPSQLAFPPGCKRQGESLVRAITHFPRRAFSHVWVIGFRIPQPERFGLDPVWSNDRSELYEVIGTPPRCRVEPRSCRKSGEAERAGV